MTRIYINETSRKTILASLLITLIATLGAVQNSTYAATGISADDTVKFSSTDLKPGQIMTPFGPWDSTKVIKWDGKSPIPSDEIIAKWNKEHPGEDSPATKIIKERAARVRSEGNAVPPLTDGWNMYTEWDSTSNLSNFKGNWVVPTAPSSYQSGDVIYTFLGLEDAAKTQIIQPVLQYGTSPACSTAAWRIASWYVVSDTVYYYSTCKTASQGNTIYGEMNNDYGQVWTITTKNVSTGDSTGLQVSTGHDWRDAFVTLETYGLNAQCSNLPGDISYTNLSINSGSVTPTWSSHYGNTWCGMSVSIGSASQVSLNNNN